jgi:hypothetical protein
LLSKRHRSAFALAWAAFFLFASCTPGTPGILLSVSVGSQSRFRFAFQFLCARPSFCGSLFAWILGLVSAGPRPQSTVKTVNVS